METTTFQGEDEDVDLQEDPILLFVFFFFFGLYLTSMEPDHFRFYIYKVDDYFVLQGVEPGDSNP